MSDAPAPSLETTPRPGASFEAPLYGWNTQDVREIDEAIRRAVRGVRRRPVFDPGILPAPGA